MPVLISLGVAGTSTLLCVFAFGWWRAAQTALASVTAPTAAADSALWLCPGYMKWPLQCIARVLDPIVTQAARRVVGKWLVRAELDTHIGPTEWLALALLVIAALPGVGFAASILLHIDAWLVVVPALLVAGLTPWLWLHDRCKRTRAHVLRDLPGCLDTLTMALEAGCAFGSALQLTVERAAASPLRRALQRCQQEMRAGRVRREALERLAQRMGIAALSATVAAIVQAEVTGVSLAPVIRAQAVRGTQERFSRAEKLAMEAPIRMLAPLVLCIFPCTFIVVGFPIAATLFWGG